MSFLQGKRALIVGIASERSIAWGIARAMHAQGAELAYTYQTDKLKSRVEKCAQQTNSEIILPCDVTDDAQIDAVFSSLKERWGHLDIVIHAVAYAPREELAGNYVEVTTREGSRIAHDVSSYSLTALAKGARPLMQDRQGALLTLSYIGAVRASHQYNVMGLAKASLEANVRYLAQALGPDGIRVNGISAGPIKTLAASGIGGFGKILQYYEKASPLGRNVTTTEVGNVAAFLCSDLASGVTGEITYVDAGFNTVAFAEQLLQTQ